jgi:hypothetical protein
MSNYLKGLSMINRKTNIKSFITRSVFTGKITMIDVYFLKIKAISDGYKRDLLMTYK